MDAYYKVVKGLKTTLLDERATAVFYAKMRDISRTYAGVEAFAEARKDELDHARELTELLEELTGTTPMEATQQITPPVFSNYCEGIAIAIDGERNAGIEYSNIIKISPYDKVNKYLIKIISDEEVHLAKFSKLYEMECQQNYQPYQHSTKI
ncbi:ferritin-like domain-containing protein [Desulfoscipio geothermicus]|uniref:Rubrerythrin n=1 Tax=Desulfoscipio geothermicus DSM 3669 TaxID=1121426 RepID=A0A1I6DNX9_9FIRM|nr:ferritin-like domain-containing protein [Desulfoscipio geothermicus]SFR07213.1 Rubrerythrin [Desulfoscipio geothermicus DSM 3669]